MLTQLLKRRVASDTGVIRLVQAACFAAAALVPLLAFRKFADWDLSEAHLLIGVLGSLSVALFFTVLGVMLEFRAKAA